MDYNLQDFQSLTQVLNALSTSTGTNAAGDLAKAVVNGGLGEPHDLTPVSEYRAFIEAWTAELVVMGDEFAARAALCQQVARALTGEDDSAAAGLSGQ